MIQNPYLIAIFGGATTAVVGTFALAALFSPDIAIGFVIALALMGYAPYR